MDFMNAMVLLHLEMARKAKQRHAGAWSLSYQDAGSRPRWPWLSGTRRS
jgi:hypothetical protein